jgi:hypothetical protein
MRKQRLSSFKPSKFHFDIVRKCAIVRYSCRAATPSKSWDEISVRGDGRDTPSGTIATIVPHSIL